MFRVKIVLLSVMISGAVLISLGLFFLSVLSKVGMERIDREILTLGESQLHVWHPRPHWRDFERSLRSIYGPERWKDLIVNVTDADHQLLYRSPHWPGEITPASFHGFDFKMAKRPGDAPPGHPGDPGPRMGPGRDNPPGAVRRRPPRRPGDGEYGAPPPRLPHPPARIKEPLFRTMETAGCAWRTGVMGNPHVTIMIGRNLSAFYEEANRFKNAFLLFVPMALLLLAGGGWLVAHRALKPITLITRTAERITARGLDRRIPEIGADSELLRLVKVINDMLDRLEKSFDQAVRFSADAAHELQTPLTILQGTLDDAIRDASSDAAERERCGGLLEEVQHLKSIVRKLLILARADADQLPIHHAPVDLSVMIESAVEDAGVIGPDLTVEKQIAPGVVIRADPDLLGMVIQGLTTNAVKYNRANGRIRFGLRVENNHALFAISNTGPLIPDDERERIFDRFYRVDKSRGQRAPGTGLGLSLAREIVRAHGGRLHLRATSDDMNTFSLSLPKRESPGRSS